MFTKEYNAEKKMVADLTTTLLNGLIKNEIKMSALWKKYVSLEDVVRIRCKRNLTVAIQEKDIVISEKEYDC